MSSISFDLNAQVRSEAGKCAGRRMRRSGMVPGIVYGAGKDPMPIKVQQNELQKRLAHEAFFSHVLTIKLDNGEEKAILRDLQRHPYKPVILHFDMQRISATERLTMRVPLHIVGADVCPGIKLHGGVLAQLINEVEVSCFAKDLPEYIDVDLSTLEIGDQVRLSDLTLPEGVELVALTKGTREDAVIISVQAAYAEVDLGEEGEEGEAEAGEGEAPTEGEGEE